MKPKAVLAYCREKGIKAVDLRFVDLDGHWRHITFPLSALTESAFEEGFGHEIQLDPQSKHPPAHAILLPQSEANYLDPFTSQPTLVLLATIQDALMREESSLDSRSVALRAMRYLESTSIGDGVAVRASYPFRTASEAIDDDANPSTFLACGPEDRDFLLRCQIADIASDAGLLIHRHFSGFAGSSEMVLKPSNLVEGCDDVMMIRYLVGQHAWRQNERAALTNLWMPSQWSILRQGESILVGTAHRGLNEMGLHAIAGILKHVDAIVAIALALGSRPTTDYPWLRCCSSDIANALCRVSISSHNPRARTIEFRGTPAASNPYLVNSAILMAMIDGIQNKMSAGAALDPNSETLGDLGEWQFTLGPAQFRQHLEDDRDFLQRGEVFSDQLLEVIGERLTQ